MKFKNSGNIKKSTRTVSYQCSYQTPQIHMQLEVEFFSKRRKKEKREEANRKKERNRHETLSV